MAITDEGTRIQYAANGVLATFPYPFEIYDESDLRVYVDSSLKTLEVDYEVSGVSPSVGGNVVFDASPANGTVITIERVVSSERTADYQFEGDFDADVINTDLDRLTAKDQELSTKLERTIRLAPEDPNADLVLPLEDERPLKIIGFNEDGDLYLYDAFLATAEVLDDQALKIPRVKSTEDGFELRTPAETRADIGANDASNLTTGTVANARLTANLSAIGGLTTAADKIGYWTGSGTASVSDFTAFARTMLDDSNAAAVRTTIGAVSTAGDTLTGYLIAHADPSSPLHVATKQYVDSVAAGLSKRASVRAATTANIDLTTDLENGDTLDGVTLATGDLVLVKNQTAQEENGIYVVAASGAASRDALFDVWAEHPGSLIAVHEGTSQADTLWLCTANSGGTLGSTAITWSQIFPGSGGTVTQVVAGTGLSGGTIISTGTIALDLDSLTEDTTPDSANDFLVTWDDSASTHKKVTPANVVVDGAITLAKLATSAKTEAFVVACSDEVSPLTTGTAKITFRMPYAFTLTAVRASLTTAQTSGSILTVDINEGGSTILSTKLTIDNGEKTSTTAATPAVISDTALADDAEMTVDVDQVGDGTAKGLKIYLIGYPT